MPDKLTDKEIVKALECCPKNIICGECPLCGTNDCMNKLYVNSLDLINRLQAENEEQEKAILNALHRIKEVRQTAKAEAYKECVEKAKEIIDLIVDLMFDGSVSKCQIPSCHKPSSIPCENESCIQENKEYWHGKLNNLLKELVGDNNV